MLRSVAFAPRIMARAVPRAVVVAPARRGYPGKVGFPDIDEEPNPTASQEGVRADHDGITNIEELQRETVYEAEHHHKGSAADHASKNPMKTDSEQNVRADQGHAE